VEFGAGHRCERAVPVAVAAGRREIDDAAPVGPQRAQAALGGERIGRVGERGRRHVAQAFDAQTAGEQVGLGLREFDAQVGHHGLAGGYARRRGRARGEQCGGAGDEQAGQRRQVHARTLAAPRAVCIVPWYDERGRGRC
jgi:hypothetical protein